MPFPGPGVGGGLSLDLEQESKMADCDEEGRFLLSWNFPKGLNVFISITTTLLGWFFVSLQDIFSLILATEDRLKLDESTTHEFVVPRREILKAADLPRWEKSQVKRFLFV